MSGIPNEPAHELSPCFGEKISSHFQVTKEITKKLGDADVAALNLLLASNDQNDESVDKSTILESYLLNFPRKHIIG